jgi:hypothetical protein
MAKLFENSKIFNQPLNKWKVDKVKDMSQMFYGALSFDQPLDNWNIHNVRNFSAFFHQLQNFFQYLGDWNLDNAFKEDIFTSKSFDLHNDLTRYTKNRLLQFIDRYKNSPELEKDQNKMKLIKYMKNFQEHDIKEFLIVTENIKEENNFGIDHQA